MPTNIPIRKPSPGIAGATVVDEGLRSYMRAVYNYMALALALTGVVAYFAATTGFYASIQHTPMMWVVLLAPFGLVMFLGFRLQKMSLGAAQAAFWALAAMFGLSLAGIFFQFTGQSIASVFFITGGTFAAMSVYGYTTRTDLTRFGSFLMMGLIGIIVASLVNFFFKSSAVQFAVSVIGVMVFVGFTAYDTQRIKALYDGADGVELAGKKAVMGALSLYLDFINLFLMLLRLFGSRR